MSEFYILKDKKAVLVNDIVEWGKMFESSDKRVAQTEIGISSWKYWLSKLFGIKHWQPVRISTVFLGLDHSFGEGEPLIFETMIFGGKFDQEIERYSTWEEAEKGHKIIVKKVIEKIS